jgi:hypothetical protein
MVRYVGHFGRQLYPSCVQILPHLSVRSFSVYTAILYIPDNPLPFLTRNLPSFRGFLTVRNRFFSGNAFEETFAALRFPNILCEFVTRGGDCGSE